MILSTILLIVLFWLVLLVIGLIGRDKEGGKK